MQAVILLTPYRNADSRKLDYKFSTKFISWDFGILTKYT